MKKYFVVALLMAFILGLHAQDTVKTYWSNKKLLSAGVKVNDKEEGHWIFYHKNGLKWTEGNYRHGERVGQWKTWYDDGRLSQEGYMDNGRGAFSGTCRSICLYHIYVLGQVPDEHICGQYQYK